MKKDSLQSIPIVEIPSTNGNYPPELVDTIGRAFTDIGFLFVRAPLISGLVRSEVFPEFRKVFALPQEVKAQYSRPAQYYNVGYAPPGMELGLACRKSGPNGEDQRDHKEYWMMGRWDQGMLPENSGAFDFENVWPVEAPDFARQMWSLYSKLYHVVSRALSVLEVYLGKEQHYFAAMTQNGPTVMRALHYPPVSQEQIDQKIVLGCGHHDVNFATGLPASTRSGLYIKHRYTGELLPGKAPDDCIIVQAGDMLHELTDGLIASAFHGVRTPNEPTTEGRLSAALFMHPRSEIKLRPGVTAGEFLQKRLYAIGLGPGKAAV